MKVLNALSCLMFAGLLLLFSVFSHANGFPNCPDSDYNRCDHEPYTRNSVIQEYWRTGSPPPGTYAFHTITNCPCVKGQRVYVSRDYSGKCLVNLPQYPPAILF